MNTFAGLTAFARVRDSGNLKLGWSVDQQSTDCNQTVLLLLTVFMKYIHCLQNKQLIVEILQPDQKVE